MEPRIKRKIIVTFCVFLLRRTLIFINLCIFTYYYTVDTDQDSNQEYFIFKIDILSTYI
jgi:hypothetical protein